MRLLTCLCLILLSSFSCQNVHGKPDEVIQQLFNRLAEALKDHEVFKRSVDGDAENSTEHSMSPEMVKIISLAMDEVIEETLKSVEVANGLSDSDPSPTPEPGQSSTVPSRQRRSDLSNNYLDPKYKNGVQKLSEIRPAFATCARPIHMSTALFQGRLFGICISAPAGGIPVVTVGEMSLSSRWTALPPEMTRFKTPLMSAVFTDDDQHLRFMIADSSGSNIVVHSMDSSGNWRESDFDFKHPIAMNVWRMQSDTKADWHLAVSNYSSTTEMKSETVFYGWRTTYFDVYHSVTSYDVRDICPFNSGGRDYVVIVNHRASPTTFNVDSELFKFDIDRRHWIFVQAFRTTGALDCEVFQLGKGGDTEKFLAIANHVDLSMGKPNYRIDSVIYKFAGSRFVPFQSIKVNGATQIKSFKGFNESFALAVAHLDGVEMFQYNGWRFIKSEVQPTQSQKAFGRGVKSMTTAKMGEDRVLIISNPLANTDSNVIQLHFKEDTSFRDWHRTGLEWCNKMRTRISLAPLVDLERKLEGTFNKNQHEPIEIPGDLVIKSNVSISGLLSSPLIYDMESHHNYSHELPIKLQHIVDHLEELERNTSRIEKVLHGALKIDGPEQVITVPLEFNEVNFKCAKAANCLIGEVLTESVNTFEVTNLEKRIIRTDRDEMINRNVVFDRMVAENIIVNGHVNGIDTADIVTKSGNHAFLVPQTFVGPVTAFDVQVKGTVNGMAISPETVLLKSGEQTVNGHVIFHEKVTVDELKTGTVNNVSLDEILPYVVTTVGKHVIRGQKEFDTLIVNDLDMLKGSTIDGVDIVDLYNNLLWKHGDQMVTGRYSFTNISVKGDLIVGGLINGIELPGPYVVYVNKPATISAPITFAAPVHIDHMHVSESLNGIKRIDQGNSDWPEQLDLVAKSKVQTITGKKIFTNLHLRGHSTVLGHVNGIDLSQFAEVAVKRSDFNEFLGKWQINGSAVFHGKLIVEGTVNGVNLDDMYKNAVKLTDTVVNVPGGLHFLGDVTAPEIMCRTVNGFIPERDWLTVHGRQVINGSMTFFGGVHLKNDFTVTGNVNGIEPKILHDSMMKYGNQVVNGPKEIHGDLFVGDLRTPQINDVKISDLVLLNSEKEQVITGAKHFKNVVINQNAAVEKMVITGLMDGVSVQDLFQNTMLYDAMQTVTGFKQFDTVVIPPNENLGAKLVNGINLPHLFSRAVMKVGPQTIAGDIVFRGPVRFENLWFHDTFDGVTDADLKRNWLLQGAHQVIDGDMVFDEDVVINGNLDISSGTINAINIRDLDRTIIKKDEPATIPGPITFREAIHSFGDVQVSGTVQGVKLASEAVIRHGNVQIGGHKVFLGNITVRQSMSVNGMIDNVHVNDLCKTVVTRFGNQVITSPTRITGTLTAPSMDVGGTIDSINLRRLNDTCVKFDEPSQVTGRKHFETLVLLGPVDVRGKVNGIDIRELDRTYFSKTRKQVIDAPVVFENGATFHGPLIVNGNMNTADGLLDGVNLQNIDQNYLKVEGDQVITAPYVFERDVHFHRDLIMNRSTVNNIPINWIALKNQSEYRISSDLDFQDDVMFRGNVSTRDPRGIDYVKLNKVRSAAGLTGPGKFVLNSVKHFGTVEVDHLLTTGLINGINFTRDNLLLTTGLNIVNGKLIFANGLNIQSNLETRTINNVNFAELEKHLARRDADNVIEGDISIEGPVVADNAVVLSFVNDVNLTHLAHTVYGKIDFDSMRSRIDFCARKLDKLDKAIQGAATCLKEYQQVFEVNSTLITSESWSPIKTVFTSKNEGPCTRVQVHDKDWSLDYGFASTFLAYKPSSIAELSIGGDNFVIIATSRQIGQIAQHCVEGDSAGLRNVRRLGSGSSMIQVLKMNRKIGRYEPLALIRNEPVTDIRIIHSDVHVGCIVVATPFTNSTTIQFSPPMVLCVTRKGDVQIRRFEPSFALGSNAIATIRSEHQRMTFVATINSLSISEQAFNVKVGQWDVNVKSFLNISKEIFAYHPTAIHFAEFKDPQSHPETFFFLAEGEVGQIMNKPLIRIYRVSAKPACELIEMQQIQETQDITKFESIITPENNLVVFTLMRDSYLKIYKYQEASGFVLMDGLHGRGATKMAVKPTFDLDHFLVMGTDSREEDKSNGVTRGLVSVHSKITSRRFLG